MHLRLRTARWAVATIFCVNGAVFATWGLHIPTIQARLGLSDGVLGTTLLAMAVGSFGIMSFVGGFIGRWGSRRVTRVAALTSVALLVPLLWAPALTALVPLLILFGMLNGTLDVAMNAQAVQIEQGYGRPVLSSFHAWFSLGGLLGAALGSWLLGLGLTPMQHVQAVTLAALALMLLAGFGTLAAAPQAPGDTAHAPAFALPRGILLALGLLAFADLVAEGAMMDWSTVYMRNWYHLDAARAGWALAAFSALMTVGRLVGDTLLARLGRVRVLSWSAWLGCVGLVGALLVDQPLALVLGCAAVGFGLANIVPVLFGAASALPGVATGTGIAGVTTVGYFGFFVGPPVIGFVAQHAGLPWAFAVVAACIGVVALAGPRVLRRAAAQSG